MNVLTAFLGKSAPALRSVLGDPFVKGLVPKGQDGYEIFHSLLADQVRSQIKEDDNWIRLQEKAVRVFEKRLAKDERDSLALRRLSSHVYEAYEPAKYVKTVDRLSNQKYTLGMILEAISELEFALLQTQQPEYKAAFYGNLGVLYWTRGDLDRAEEMMRNALAINEELGRKEGMASGYGNLGNLYETRGDLDRAEELLKQACSIYLTIGAGGKNLHIFEEAIDRIKAIKKKRK